MLPFAPTFGTQRTPVRYPQSADLRILWWALEDLNLRPLPCQGSALPLS
jgi:hypothetical protein